MSYDFERHAQSIPKKTYSELLDTRVQPVPSGERLLPVGRQALEAFTRLAYTLYDLPLTRRNNGRQHAREALPAICSELFETLTEEGSVSFSEPTVILGHSLKTDIRDAKIWQENGKLHLDSPLAVIPIGGIACAADRVGIQPAMKGTRTYRTYSTFCRQNNTNIRYFRIPTPLQSDIVALRGIVSSVGRDQEQHGMPHLLKGSVSMTGSDIHGLSLVDAFDLRKQRPSNMKEFIREINDDARAAREEYRASYACYQDDLFKKRMTKSDFRHLCAILTSNYEQQAAELELRRRDLNNPEQWARLRQEAQQRSRDPEFQRRLRRWRTDPRVSVRGIPSSDRDVRLHYGAFANEVMITTYAPK